MVDHFEEDHDVWHHGSSHPDPEQTFLTEMLRVEGFRLEVQVLALVIPLVGNIVPEDLAVWLEEVGFGDAESVSAANVIDGEVFGIVLRREGGDGGFGGGLEWLGVLVGVGSADGAWIQLEVGVQGVVVSPVEGLGVMATTEGETRRPQHERKSSFSEYFEHIHASIQQNMEIKKSTNNKWTLTARELIWLIHPPIFVVNQNQYCAYLPMRREYQISIFIDVHI